MSNIIQNLALILAAKYGRDVRQAIHDSIEDCYNDIFNGDFSWLYTIVAEVLANALSADSARILAEGYAAQLAAGVASPVGTYADLAALNAADPDHSKIYITLNDGYWCYYSGAAFVAGGVYQATLKTGVFYGGSIDFTEMSSLVYASGSFITRYSAKPFTNRGKLTKLYFKTSSEATNTQFIIGLQAGENITVIDSFTCVVSSAQTEYINGVDFTYDEYVEESYIIGYQYTGVRCYYGGTDGQLVAVGQHTADPSLVFGAEPVGISIGAECEDQQSVDLAKCKTDIINIIKETSALSSGNFVGGQIDHTDMGSIINGSGTPVVRFNGVPFASNGRLTKLYLKQSHDATPTNTRFFIGRRTGNTFEVIGTFTVYLISTETEYVNGVDFTYDEDILAGDYIGIRLYTQLLLFGGTAGSYTCAEAFDVDPIAVFDFNDYGIALGAECKTHLAIDMEQSQSDINDIDNELDVITSMIAQKKYYGVELASNIYNVMDSDVLTIKVQPSTLTGTMLLLKKNPVNEVGQTAFVDFANNKIGFYWAGTTVLLEDKTVSFAFAANHEYCAELVKEDYKTSIIRITDMYTLDTDELSVSTRDAGSAWGIREYTYTFNSAPGSVISAVCYSTQNKDTRCLIIGDSYIEGNSLDNSDNRFAYLIKSRLFWDCFINGQGGANSGGVLSWLTGAAAYLFTVCNPTYTIVNVGMNDTVYATWVSNIQGIIAAIKTAGSIPILITVCANTTGGSAAIFDDMNAWIRASGELYIDANIILSTDYAGLVQNAAYFMTDQIHPTVAGHELIYKRALLDVPMLFA